MTIKILHLSDLHFTGNDQANEPLLARLRFIAQRYPEHFYVITGDIVDGEGAVAPGTPLPIPTALAIAPALLASAPPPLGPLAPHLEVLGTSLRKALAALSLLPTGKVVLCAGNHDFALWGNLYFAEFAAAFDELLFTPITRQAPVDGSIVAKTALYLDSPTPSCTKPMLYSITRGGQSLALFSICTPPDAGAVPTLPGFDLAAGSVGGRQLQALQTAGINPLLGGAAAALGPRFVMMHHHPFIHDATMELTDASAFMGIARNSVDLLLFGHRHREKRYEAAEVPGGGFRHGALAAGSSRAETGAWEVTLTPGPIPFVSPPTVTFSRVPII